MELKTLLDIPPGNTKEDAKILLLAEMASGWIEELINRPGFSKKERTEYYNGTGTQNLLLRSRPVFTTPTIQVYMDEDGFYGSTSGAFNTSTDALTYGVDFCLDIDQEDGTSRSGILVRMNQLWPKRFARQRGLLSPFIANPYGNIKCVYTGGYTIDTVPAQFRLGCNLLITRLKNFLPLGMELSSESYEERAISMIAERKDYLLSSVKPILWPYRNWKW